MLRNPQRASASADVITGHERRAIKAVVYRARQDLRYESISEPSARAGRVLVKVKYAGVCHTDFNEYANGPDVASLRKRVSRNHSHASQTEDCAPML